jgi:hypothetical protein
LSIKPFYPQVKKIISIPKNILNVVSTMEKKEKINLKQIEIVSSKEGMV